MVTSGEYAQAEKAALEKDSNGSRYLVGLINGFVPSSYNEISLTYVTSGNGIGEIETVVYKLDSVSVGTLTLSYNSSNNLSGVVRS